jgi:hypothetical protein
MCRAWRKRSCSSSVHLSRGRVIVYGLRSFVVPRAAEDGAAGILTPLIIDAVVLFSLPLSLRRKALVLSPSLRRKAENFSRSVAGTTVKSVSKGAALKN